MINEVPPKRLRPDGYAVAIRTVFDDDHPGAVSSWLSVNADGVSAYLTEAQVADWPEVKESTT